MKFTLALLATIGFGIAAHLIFPWWFVVIATGLVAAGVGFKTGKSFLVGFLGIAILWGAYAGYLNWGNEGILANRMSHLLSFDNAWLMVGLTALLGGLLGGLAGITGSMGRQLFD